MAPPSGLAGTAHSRSVAALPRVSPDGGRRQRGLLCTVCPLSSHLQNEPPEAASISWPQECLLSPTPLLHKTPDRSASQGQRGQQSTLSCIARGGTHAGGHRRMQVHCPPPRPQREQAWGTRWQAGMASLYHHRALRSHTFDRTTAHGINSI